MNKVRVLLGVVLLPVLMDVCSAEQTSDVWRRDTLTEGFWGLNDQLADDGIEVGFGLTNIYQANVKGGLGTHNKRGRYSGSYDLELTTDMEKLFGIEGGILYIHGEGWWSKSGGIDGTSVGSAFGVNGDAGSRDTLVITELWWQPVLGDTFRLRLGKLDMTGGFEHHGCPVSFDCSSFANDETSQFLNNALINNPTIPFPDYGLGAVLHWSPIKWWYASIGAADARADARETGLKTTFHGEDYFLYIFETGVSPSLDSENGPLQGTYRIGFWNDPQPKANEDVAETRDDVGFYACFDQVLTKENSDPEDSQGIGTFFRYGYAPSKRNDITSFWSFGFQYQGLVDGRDDDVLGVGFAQGIFSDSADTTYTDDYENAVELYYNVQAAGWLNISPSIQYVTNPGGNKAVSDAVILGVRAQMTF